MLKKLRIKNFQGQNRPLGDGIIRKGQSGNVFTSMETDTCTVTKEKGAKTNQYTLSGEKEPYTGFGQNPPEEIVDALNFDEINIQPQLDLPFLVLASPGHVAQHIRSISGLDIVDKVTALIKSKLSAKSNLLSTRQEELKETKVKLFELEKIDTKRMEELIRKAEELMEENREVSLLENSLQKIVDELQDVEKTWITLPEDTASILEKGTATISDLEQAKVKVSNLTALLEELKEVKETWIDLPEDMEAILEKGSTAVSEHKLFQAKISNLAALLEELVSLEKEIVEIPELGKDFIFKIEATEKQYNNMGDRIRRLDEIISELQEAEAREKEIDKQIKEEQDALFSLLDQITVCPVCTSALTDETKKELLENYEND
jgi:DNA repair exonuclease SbcCD ATPase subunit